MFIKTIEECKTHMVDIHKVDMDTLSANSNAIDISTGDLSSETQTNLPAPDEELTVIDDEDPPAGTAMADTADVPSSALPISEREEMPNGKVSMSTQVCTWVYI